MGNTTKRTKSEGSAKSYPLSGVQALQVLSMLKQRHPELESEISELSSRVFNDICTEDVAQEVYSALNSLEAHDCWEASGRQWGGGYRDEYEVADEMVSEAFSPFLFQINTFHTTGEFASELAYIQGVLMGLYRFQKEATTDFSDYAEDYPESFATDILGDWSKRHPDDSSSRELLRVFLSDQCPDWAKVLQAILAR
jgi:hypothetical protein